MRREELRQCARVLERRSQDPDAVSTFFFSSRRRHTRSLCDWSSDVCSSDLLVEAAESAADALAEQGFTATVWDVRVATPLDPRMITDARAHRVVVTVEDGVAEGGVGSLEIGRASCRERGGCTWTADN